MQLYNCRSIYNYGCGGSNGPREHTETPAVARNCPIIKARPNGLAQIIKAQTAAWRWSWLQRQFLPIMYRRQFLRRLLCPGEPTAALMCLVCDKIKYAANFMFLIAAPTVVNASAAWDAYERFFSVEIEGRHTAHHLPSVETFLEFVSAKLISENGYV